MKSMRKLAFLLVTLLAVASATAQVDTLKVRQIINAHGYLYKNGGFDSSITFPQDTFRLKYTWRGLAFKDTLPYFWTGRAWRPFGSGTGGTTDTTSLSNRINQKLNIADTANKWVTAVRRSNDSVFYQKGGSWTFAYKDSTGGSDLSAYINNSYLLFDSTYSPLGGARNDSTGIIKSVRIRRNNVTVTPTQIGDSAMYWNIDVPIPDSLRQEGDSLKLYFTGANDLSVYNPAGAGNDSAYVNAYLTADSTALIMVRDNNLQDTFHFRVDTTGWTFSDIDTTNLSARIDAKLDTASGWRTTGNYNTSPTTNYIGTADVQPLMFKVNNIQAGFLTARPEPTSAGSGSVTLGQYAGQELGTNNGANTLIGHGAGAKIKYNPLKANQNTFIGLWAGYWTKYHSDPFGGRSVLVGQSSGFWNYDGSSLAGLGAFSLEMNNRGNNNTALGRDALRSNIDGSYGTGVGSLSLLSNTTGIKTIAVTNGGSGYTTATVNISAPPGPTPGVAWGVATATATISGGVITAITVTDPGAGYSINYADSNTRHPQVTVTITGDGTGATADVTETESAMGNTALGHGSGYLNKFGNYNVEIGYLTTLNSRGDYNTLIGYQAGPGTGAPTVMSNGIAIGKNAKVSANNSMALGGTGADTIRVGINTETPRFKLDVVGGDILVHELRIGRGAGSVATNTVFGDSALANNTTQFGNTVFGYQASKNGTPSSANTIIGYRAGNSSTYAGTGNIIVGYESQYLNRANESVAIGLRSMYTQGSNGSVGVGAYTLYNNVRNKSVGRAMNTAIGDYSYYSLTGSSSLQTNTGVGAYSGYGITTGSYNTAIGALSMGKGYSGVGTAGSSGTFNTALGHASLYYQNNSTGNIGIGTNTFNNPSFNPSSGYNIGIGYEAGKLMTTGNYNVLLGGYIGSSHAAVSNHIILSDGQGNIRFILDSLANTKFYGTGAHVFQKGTTAQRPTIESASFRYNTDSSKFEWSDGINWYSFGSGGGGGTTYKVGTYDTQTRNTNGASIVSDSIYMQQFDAENPGLVPPGGSSSTFLRGDGTWQTVSGGGGSPAGNFGNIQINRNGSFATPGSDSLIYTNGELRVNTSDNGAYSLQVAGNGYFKGSYAGIKLDANAGTYSSISLDDAAGGAPQIDGDGGLSYRVPTASYKHNFYNGAILSMQIENSAGLSTTGVINTSTSQITSSYTGSVGTDKGAFHLERTIDAGASGPNHHGFVSKTTFRTGAGAFNSFYAQDVIGRTGANQDHWAGFQTRITKDSNNTVSTLYDFVALGSLMNGGTATNRYGYYMFDANTAGGGTLTNQYGIYIPTLTGGTNNWAAYFGSRIQIKDGTEAAGRVLTSDANGIASWQAATGGSGVDSIWRTPGVDSIKWRKNGITYAIKDSIGTGGSASPGGSDTYVQFNDGGSFGGDAGLTYDKTNNSIKQAGVGASLSGYMQTNSGQLASTTNLNPGILVYNGSNNPYGVDLGYNSSRYSTRVFAASGNLSFGTMAAGSTLHSNFTELMFLNSTGLGIGITSPSEKLDVSGNGRFTGTLQTADPGSGAGAWKFGQFHSASGLILDSAGYIEVNIGGTVYWLALAATPFPKPNPKP